MNSDIFKKRYGEKGPFIAFPNIKICDGLTVVCQVDKIIDTVINLFPAGIKVQFSGKKMIQNDQANSLSESEFISKISSLLVAEFGPVEQKKQNPLEQLIRTILSQQTTSENTRRAYQNLRDLFPEWKRVAEADHSKLVEAVRVAGLANQKAERIQRILHQVKDDFGAYDLSALEKWSDEDILNYLENLPGVGQKTSRCVLIFALQRSAIPVDTHVARIARRLGLVEATATANQISDQLHELIPAHLRPRFHIHFFELGRRTCKARKPLCHQC